MIPIFEKAANSILARLGQDAFLRGTEPCRAQIQYGVEIIDAMNEVATEQIVVTLMKSLNAKRGDSLVVGSKSFVIDSPAFQDNGTTVKHVVREVA